MTKKLIALLLALAMIFTLASCGKEDKEKAELPNGGIEGYFMNQNITITVKEYAPNGTVVELEQTGNFTGDFVLGVPTGDAIFESTNSQGVSYTYSGYFDNGTFNGYGKKQLNDSTRYYEKGTFTDGLYTPTMSEYIENVGNNNLNGYGGFALTEDCKLFLSSRSELFPCENPNLLSEAVSADVTIAGLKNDFENNDGKLIKLTKLTVSSVENKSTYGYDASITLAKDAYGNNFVIYAPFESGYEAGDEIATSYVLPLANVSYTSDSGSQVNAIAVFASYLF